MDGYRDLNSRVGGFGAFPLLPGHTPPSRKKSLSPFSPWWWDLLFRRNSITALILVSIAFIYLIVSWGSSSLTLLPIPTPNDNTLVINRSCMIPRVPLWSETYLSASSAATQEINQCGNGSKFTKFKDSSVSPKRRFIPCF